jgi:hypothetical protein
MGCRNDYMNPNESERQALRAAELIVYTFTAQGLAVPEWAQSAANDCYGRSPGDEDSVAFLCEHLRAIPTRELDNLLYGDARNKKARRLADWWEEHLERDRARDEREKEERERAILREQAKSKLTTEERDSLGL